MQRGRQRRDLPHRAIHVVVVADANRGEDEGDGGRCHQMRRRQRRRFSTPSHAPPSGMRGGTFEERDGLSGVVSWTACPAWYLLALTPRAPSPPAAIWAATRSKSTTCASSRASGALSSIDAA